MPTLADAAVALGLPCFPCDIKKRPCVKGGFKSASRNAEEIRNMFRAPGAVMIGVPTGEASDLVVIDVDIKHDQPGMAWLTKNADALPPTRTHKTQSGGLHLVFKRPEGFDIRNSASRVAPGIDVRAEGGYIVSPPSPGYQIADNTPPADMPQWLIRACMRPEPPFPEPIRKHDPITEGGTRYGLSTLDRECDKVRNASPGTQEKTLNEASLRIGSLVAGGQINEGTARRSLIDAGCAMFPAAEPWMPAEVEAKVRRGMSDGSRRPRAPVERDWLPDHMFDPSEIPEPPPHTDEDLRQYGEFVSTLPKEKSIPKQPPGKVLPFTMFDEMAANLDALDFVEGVLIEGAMSVIYGESNSGKTFWATDLALHIAAGMEWNSRAVERGAVIYLALEGSHGISNRVAAFKERHAMNDASIPFAVVTVSLNLLDPTADAAAVIATVKAVSERMECPVRLVVVDTLARAIAGGNENASEDMGALVATGDMIRQETAAHLMWIHHSGKEQAKGARGHSSLRGATDTEIEITADGDVRQAEVKKQRDMPKGDVFQFELSIVELGTNRRGKPVTSCVVEAKQEQSESVAPDRRRALAGNTRRAFDLLVDLAGQSGQPGHGCPDGVNSVPDKWWRERFYESAMAGAEQAAKQKAFRRAADDLVERRFVGMMRDRVWVINKRHEEENGSDHV